MKALAVALFSLVSFAGAAPAQPPAAAPNWVEGKNYFLIAQPQPTNLPNQVAYSDSGTGFSWGNYGNTYGHNASHNFNTRFAMSYVTGSHAFRAGIQNGWGWIKHFRSSNGDMVQEYNNGVPFQVIRWDFPILQGESDLDRNMGIFLQDSWTLRRLTLNPGLRYEIVKGSLPAQSAPAGRFVSCPNAPSDA